jgi:hypothetical protein
MKKTKTKCCSYGTYNKEEICEYVRGDEDGFWVYAGPEGHTWDEDYEDSGLFIAGEVVLFVEGVCFNLDEDLEMILSDNPKEHWLYEDFMGFLPTSEDVHDVPYFVPLNAYDKEGEALLISKAKAFLNINEEEVKDDPFTPGQMQKIKTLLEF